jgi:hypothetical protein
MAFTGSAIVKQISDRIVRISPGENGLSLAAGASGVIVLHGAVAPPVGAIILPVSFQPQVYEFSNVPGLVSFQDAIDVSSQPAAVGTATAIPTATVKTGTTAADFTITITNTHGATATPSLEIYVKLHD